MSDLPAVVVPAAVPVLPGAGREPGADPARVYVATLAPSGRRTMAVSLEHIARAFSRGRAGADQLDWASVRHEHVAALRSELVTRVAAGELAPATANRHLAALRGALRAAWRMGQMSTEDYHRAIDVGRVAGTRLVAGREVPAVERTRLLDAIPDTPLGIRDRALIALLYFSGARRAELAAAQLHDLDLHHRPPGLRVIGKGQRERLVPLSEDVGGWVAPWLELRGSQPGPLLCAVDRWGHVHAGRALSGEALRQVLLRRAKAAGIPPLTPHDLRRTVAGDLLDAGADLPVVATILGHASVTTTAAYDRRGQRAAEEAAGTMHLVETK